MGGKKAAGENTKKAAGNARVCSPAPAITVASVATEAVMGEFHLIFTVLTCARHGAGELSWLDR